MHEATASSQANEPRLSTTVVMSLAAVAAALIAIFGDKAGLGSITVTFALVGLVPWALDAGGVHLHPLAFFLMTMGPAAMIILVDRNPGGMFPVLLAVVSITRQRCSTLLIGLCVVIAVGFAIGLAILEGTAHETGMVYFIGGVGVAWLAGEMLARQEALVRVLQEATAREHRHAAAEERTRIAREVHDVVAHSLTVTMLHVTGARRALTHDPSRAAEALERAETVGRESLESIRQMVGLLRTHDPSNGVDESAAPLPELADIPALVDQFRQAGLRIAADLELEGVSADPTTSLTAFRVVQEALSNALQHSPGAPVELSVAEDGHGTVLRIVAENPTHESGASARPGRRVGLGLLGMSERVRAAGGSVEAGATDVNTWRIEAALPLRRAAVLS